MQICCICIADRLTKCAVGIADLLLKWPVFILSCEHFLQITFGHLTDREISENRLATPPSSHSFSRIRVEQIPHIHPPPPAVRQDTVYALAFSPDGRFLVSGGADCALLCWDMANGHLISAVARHTDTVYCLQFSRDGALLASGALWGRMGVVIVIDWVVSLCSAVRRSDKFINMSGNFRWIVDVAWIFCYFADFGGGMMIQKHSPRVPVTPNCF